MRDIVIIANFCGDFSKTDNGRFLYLANLLSESNEVEIVTSDFLHIAKKKREFIEKRPFTVTLLNEPGYKKNISFKRFYSHYRWGKQVEKYLFSRKVPDVIYCAIPSLTVGDVVAKYCKKTGTKFIIDIQDLWPEAFKMIVNVPILSDVAFKPFKIMADYIYKNADDICGVSKTYVDRALKMNKKCKNAVTVFLGTDLEIFDAYATVKDNSDREKDTVKIAYCGTLGSSYDLKSVFDALEMLGSHANYEFIVMGDGPLKKEFENYSNKKNINVIFTGRLNYDEMCKRLAECDIAVNPIKSNSAASIINKHADYAASGIPVVNTQESVEYRNLIESYRMGYNCINGDYRDLADKLGILMNDKELRVTMGKNARRCAEEKFDRKNSYRKIIEVITS